MKRQSMNTKPNGYKVLNNKLMEAFIKNRFGVIVFLLIFSSCEKEEAVKPVDPNSAEAWLLDPATGWQHVMSIDTKDKGLSGCDITPVGQEIAVLYKSTKNNQSDIHYHKVKFGEGDSQTPAGTMLGFSTSGRTIYYSQFIPESYTAVFTNVEYVGDQHALIDENNTRTVRFGTEISNPGAEFINYYYTKAADYLGAAIKYKTSPTGIQYGTSKFPPTPVTDGFMPKISADYVRGSFTSKMVIPDRKSVV